jgi:hypothetical protein
MPFFYSYLLIPFLSFFLLFYVSIHFLVSLCKLCTANVNCVIDICLVGESFTSRRLKHIKYNS